MIKLFRENENDDLNNVCGIIYRKSEKLLKQLEESSIEYIDKIKDNKKFVTIIEVFDEFESDQDNDEDSENTDDEVQSKEITVLTEQGLQYVLFHHESFYAKYYLQQYFNLHYRHLKDYIYQQNQEIKVFKGRIKDFEDMLYSDETAMQIQSLQKKIKILEENETFSLKEKINILQENVQLKIEIIDLKRA